MFRKIFKRGGGDDEPQATRANLGEQSTMYYDPEKKRWRERGKEHLEEEEKEIAPPPTASETKKEEDKPKEEPAKPASAADLMCAPPAYRSIGGRPKAAPTTAAKPPEGEAADGPPPGPSAPPSGGPPMGSPFGGVKPAGEVASNPFAPKGFGGATTTPSNPFAPRASAGGAVPMNPNAPRGRDPAQKRERPKAQPVASRGSPFGSGPMYSPMPTSGGASADPEGADDDPEGEQKEPPAGMPPSPAAGEGESKPPAAKPRPAFGAFPGVLPPSAAGGLPGVLPPGVLPPGVLPAPTPSAEEGEDKDEEAEDAEGSPAPEPATDSPKAADAPEDAEADPEGSKPVDPEVDTPEADGTEAPAADPPQPAEPENPEDGEVVKEAPAAEEPEDGEIAEASPPPAATPEPEEFAEPEEIEDSEVVGEIPAAAETPEDGEIAEDVEEKPEADAAEVVAPDDGGWGDFDVDLDDAAKPPEPAAAPEEPPKAAAAEVADDGGWDDFDMDDDVPAASVAPASAAEVVESPSAVEEDAADKDAADSAAVSKEECADGNGESISSWVDLGSSEEQRAAAEGNLGESKPDLPEAPEVAEAEAPAFEEPEEAVEEKPEAPEIAKAELDEQEPELPEAKEPQRMISNEPVVVLAKPQRMISPEEEEEDALKAHCRAKIADADAAGELDAAVEKLSEAGEPQRMISNEPLVVLAKPQKNISPEEEEEDALKAHCREKMAEADAAGELDAAVEKLSQAASSRQVSAESAKPEDEQAKDQATESPLAAQLAQHLRDEGLPEKVPEVEDSASKDVATEEKLDDADFGFDEWGQEAVEPVAVAQPVVEEEKTSASEAALKEQVERLQAEQAQSAKELSSMTEEWKTATERLAAQDAEIAAYKEKERELEQKLSDKESALEQKLSEKSHGEDDIQKAETQEKFRRLSDDLSATEEKLRQVEQELEEAKLKAKEAEEEADRKAREATEEADRKVKEAMEEAERKVAEAEERAAAAAASPQAKTIELDPRSPGPTGGEEFNLPDFVWNCGNSQVMQYVQELVSENSSLKRQAKPDMLDRSADEVNPTRDVPCTSALFDTKEVDVDRVMAFLSTVGDNDGHQIQPLVTLLGEHASNALVCSQVCVALENLTFTDTENRKTIVDQGGIEAIMKFIEDHQDEKAAVLRPGIDALWNITFHDEAVDRMSESGDLLERFLKVVQKHTDATDVQAGACAVLLNLSVKDRNRWKIVELGGVALVATAMQRHSQCEEVLEQGCQALYMLAYHQDLRPIVQEKCGNVATLAAAYPHGAGRAQKWGRWLQEVLAC